MNLICFSHFYSLPSLLWIFIEHRSQRSGENNPELNWHYQGALISTNAYRGPQQILYCQPETYNKGQQYCHDRTPQKVTSKHLHDRIKVDNQSRIHCGIPPIHKLCSGYPPWYWTEVCIKKIHYFLLVVLWWQNNRDICQSQILSCNWKRGVQLPHLKTFHPFWYQQK